MEHLVVPLETAKKLKAAGFPETSIIWHLTGCLSDPRYDLQARIAYRNGVGKTDHWVGGMIRTSYVGDGDMPAPTVQEIADQLPNSFDLEMLDDRPPDSKYQVDGYAYPDGAVGSTMAEALASLWLKLHEQPS